MKYSLLTIDITINKTKKKKKYKKNLDWYTIKQDDRKSLLTIDITDNIDINGEYQTHKTKQKKKNLNCRLYIDCEFHY